MEEEIAVQRASVEPTAFRSPSAPSLAEQLSLIDRAATEFRRRLVEERVQAVAQHERRVLEALERHRRELSQLQADLNDKLRENDLLSRKAP